jgi:hypothetical protein
MYLRLQEPQDRFAQGTLTMGPQQKRYFPEDLQSLKLFESLTVYLQVKEVNTNLRFPKAFIESPSTESILIGAQSYFFSLNIS